MQAVILIGIQATGKTTFFNQQFGATHLRISLDVLRTRHRETAFLMTCLQTRMPFVVDNTNPTAADRAKYIAAAKEHGYEVQGYYFQSAAQAALERNRQRPEAERVPELGILGTYNKLELPSYAEGFDRLYYVQAMPEGSFKVEAWQDEI
jgi:predicted kinase